MFLILLISALGLRLVLSQFGVHHDLLTNTDWSRYLFEYGPKGFYEVNIWTYSWPTQPPLINLVYGFNSLLFAQLNTLFTNISYFIAINRLAPTYFLWWFEFNKWFGNFLYGDTTQRLGLIMTMKLLPILADLLIATLIYYLAKKFNRGYGYIYPLLYLFSPFTVYISSIWGQYDQLAFLPLFLSLILLNGKYYFFTPILFAISIGLKPTGLIFTPLILALSIKRGILKDIVLASIPAAVFSILTLKPFTDQNLITYIQNDLINKVFYKSEFRVSTNSFNFWRILIGDQALNHNTPFLLIPARIWGIISFIILNYLAFKQLKQVNLENILKASFIIGLGSWLFLTNMLDRYAFSGIVFLLVLCVFSSKLLKYWLILSLIFALNLYNQWFFPPTFIADFLSIGDGIFTRVLSLINVVVFLRITLNYLGNSCQPTPTPRVGVNPM